VISSGDIGVYAMATLVFEEMREDDAFEVNVVPGITAANACASLLGSPLSHDFATLSLSNLMCPWDWIEERARHIAAADLACVLYNVQSKARADGVYRVIDVLLEHKSPDTLCGVVRNAYRPEQSVAIHRLCELTALRFDMLTTIVIGNRFTRRKRNWIFTPRGYNSWATAQGSEPDFNPPKNAVWVFSGTSDGNALARELAEHYGPIVVSTASEYGGDLVRQQCRGVTVWAGRQGVERRRQALHGSRARAIVDATHPYAQQMSEQLIALAKELDLPYLRYERPSTLDGETALLCDTVEEAAARAIATGRRIFLATGSKDLATFLQATGAHEREWFLRITPDPTLIRRAIALGIRRDHLIAMQGPFSEELNMALWRGQGIDCVVTKDSGEAGGFQAKVRAAASLAIPLVVIRRPRIAYPRSAADFAAVKAQLRASGLAQQLLEVGS
jgi:precorrin-3B C17-methyltransferase